MGAEASRRTPKGRSFRVLLRRFADRRDIGGPNESRRVATKRNESLADEELRELFRRKLAALSSLYESLAEANAVYLNPVDGVERPKADANEGRTPALGGKRSIRIFLHASTDSG